MVSEIRTERKRFAHILFKNQGVVYLCILLLLKLVFAHHRAADVQIQERQLLLVLILLILNPRITLKSWTYLRTPKRIPVSRFRRPI